MLMFVGFFCSLRSAHEELEIYRRKLNTLDDYERQIRLLRDEVSYLSTEKALLQERCFNFAQNTNTVYTLNRFLLLILSHI